MLVLAKFYISRTIEWYIVGDTVHNRSLLFFAQLFCILTSADRSNDIAFWKEEIIREMNSMDTEIEYLSVRYWFNY